MKKIILCAGDSWTAGHFINPDPELKDIIGTNHSHPKNDDYRLPKVWPYKLGKLLEVDVLNVGYAGASNDGIVREIFPEVLKLLQKYKSEEIFVMVGWSSPERKDFYYKGELDGELINGWETLYPAELNSDVWKYKGSPLADFYKLYVSYFWNEEEYVSRYISHNLYLHYFLKDKKIEHLFFDSFYEPKLLHGDKIYSSMDEDIEFQDYTGRWFEKSGMLEEFIELKRKYFVDKSFRKYLFDNTTERLKKKNVLNSNLWDDYHPSELGHEFWAKTLKEILNAEKLF
tara:strand:- start:2093 stop:2950 length:858 start_codon:yes stop_codon:yes gene_type:complete